MIESLVKFAGKRNPPSMWTKFVSPSEIVNETKWVNLEVAEGRAEQVPAEVAAERAGRR